MTRTPARLDAVVTVARFAFAESLRRRVFAVVAVLTVVFLALYGLGSHFAFEETEGFAATAADLADERAITGSTVFGLAMFATLFLGAVLATFLTIGVVRGDAETGLLQPLVVRPLGRGAMLVARYAGAALASGVYVLVVYAIALAITSLTGDWTPDHIVVPGLVLAGATTIIAAISVLASVFMTSTAQGIAVFMIFGAGLVAGLLGQIGNALNSDNLIEIAEIAHLGAAVRGPLPTRPLRAQLRPGGGSPRPWWSWGRSAGRSRPRPAWRCGRRSTPARWSRAAVVGFGRRDL